MLPKLYLYSPVLRQPSPVVNKGTHKLDNETNNGVRIVISLKGMTGYGATYVSTKMKKIPLMIDATNSPQINGCDHGISSVDFKLKPSRIQPTVPTSVKDPRKSIRLILS